MEIALVQYMFLWFKNIRDVGIYGVAIIYKSKSACARVIQIAMLKKKKIRVEYVKSLTLLQ